MKTSKPSLPTVAKGLHDLGQRLRLARLRRHMSAETVAMRARITRSTLSRIEGGDGGVSMRNYASVLAVLQLNDDLHLIAKDDDLGRRLQDLEAPIRSRAPKRLAIKPIRGTIS